MSDLCRLIWCALIGLFRPRAALEAENLVLRHQLNVLHRKASKRVTLSSIDRLLLVGLYRLAPEVLDALKIIRPETLIRWHRAGFRAFWRWKSRPRGGRPPTPADIRRLIREMSVANPLWGAPRIHGELLKLGIDVGQTTVAKYMARRRRPPSQGWKTFLRNHADGIASMDLFLVPTISFRLLYGLLILQHSRRKLLWLAVTAHPNAEWLARQLTEAYGWQQPPRYIIRDRDRIYGSVFTRRIRAMGIRDRPIAPHSPWQNGCAERLIGSIRQDCLDHVVVFGERHLRHLLKSYQKKRGAHAPVIAEGRANSPCRPDHRPDVGRADFGWTAPSIYPIVSFRQGHALEALFATLAAKAGAAIPPPLQNESLPARLLMEAPDGLQKYLNVWDSGEDVPDEFLGADILADGYELTWSVPVEFVVAGGERAVRRAAFETGLDAIWEAIAADRTLGGTVSHAEVLTPRRTGAGLITDGLPNVLAAEITVRLSFTSSKSF